MNPLLLIALVGGGVVVASQLSKPKLKGVLGSKLKPLRPKGSLKLKMVPGSHIISTLDLVRIASRICQGVPTPWYPDNVSEFNAAVEAFNAGNSTERQMRLEATRTLIKACVIGLNSMKREQMGPIDLPARLADIKQGKYWPEAWGSLPDDPVKIAEKWPQALGPKQFVSQLTVALIADPQLSIFPEVRERSHKLRRFFVQAIAHPEPGEEYDGHDVDEVMANSANNHYGTHYTPQQLRERGQTMMENAFIGWSKGRGIEVPATITDPLGVASLGTKADQLAYIELLANKLNRFLVDKYCWWPGGPASSPYVDWGWIALWFIKAIGAASVPGVGLIGLYGLAKEAADKGHEWQQKGKAAEGPRETRVAAELAKAGISAYGKVSS